MNDRESKEPDRETDEMELKRFEYDTTPPSERMNDREGWRARRRQVLRELLHGPTELDDWHRAHDEELDLRHGPEDDAIGR